MVMIKINLNGKTFFKQLRYFFPPRLMFELQFVDRKHCDNFSFYLQLFKLHHGVEKINIARRKNNKLSM